MSAPHRPPPNRRDEEWPTVTHNVVSEMSKLDASMDDMLDAVYGIVGHDTFIANEAAITEYMRSVR